ncbi:unnamed protein product [Mytilus edulis]|uniref:Uncharacterized protein n=1 Tax=Mytilus edulis TaxID=6550 RepID=A0A8S3TZ36_MYTED|nr:unnamed protein product [Mytilus edulis]
MTMEKTLTCRSGETMNVNINHEVVLRHAMFLAYSHDGVGSSFVSVRSKFDIFWNNFIDQQLSLYEMEWHYYSQCMSISAVHSQIRQQVSFSHSYLVFQIPVSLLTYLTDKMVNCPSKLLNRSLTANATILFQVIEGRSIRDWKTLMSVTKNKQAFFRFIGDFIVQKRCKSNFACTKVYGGYCSHSKICSSELGGRVEKLPVNCGCGFACCKCTDTCADGSTCISEGETCNGTRDTSGCCGNRVCCTQISTTPSTTPSSTPSTTTTFWRRRR